MMRKLRVRLEVTICCVDEMVRKLRVRLEVTSYRLVAYPTRIRLMQPTRSNYKLSDTHTYI
jgi:hypothetical protein